MYLYRMALLCLVAKLANCLVYSPDWQEYFDARKDEPLLGPFGCSEGYSLLLTAQVNRLLIIHSAPNVVSNKDLLMYKDDKKREIDGLKRVNLHIAATNDSIYIAGNGWNITEHENNIGGAATGFRINIMCMKDVFIIYIGQEKNNRYRTMDRFVTVNLYGSIQSDHNNFYIMGGHPELLTYVDENGFNTFQNLPFETPLGSTAAGSNNGWVIIRLYVRGSKFGDFDVQFMQGGDVGFVISARFKFYNMIMNSKINGTWGEEQSVKMFFDDPPWIDSLVFLFKDNEVNVYGDNINHLIGTYTMPSATLMDKCTISKNDVEETAMDQPLDIIGFDQGWNE